MGGYCGRNPAFDGEKLRKLATWGALVWIVATPYSQTAARLNVELALDLVEAGITRLHRAAADLLAVQISEHSGFETRASDVDLVADYLRAVSDHRAGAVESRPMPAIR